MDDKKLTAILPMIVSSLADRILSAYDISEDEAISNIYNSKLYAALENENTKVWQFSDQKLFDMYQEEINTGYIDYPEY